MKVLIVYDSVYGNTEKIAKAIGEAIIGEVKVLRTSGANLSELECLDLLIVGAPTHAGRASPAAKDFLNTISDITGVNVTAFDTRLTTRWVRIFGYAAGRIGKDLEKKGGKLIAPPEGFFVKGKEGPLKEGEIERATSWAKKIVFE